MADIQGNEACPGGSTSSGVASHLDVETEQIEPKIINPDLDLNRGTEFDSDWPSPWPEEFNDILRWEALLPKSSAAAFPPIEAEYPQTTATAFDASPSDHSRDLTSAKAIDASQVPKALQGSQDSTFDPNAFIPAEYQQLDDSTDVRPFSDHDVTVFGHLPSILGKRKHGVEDSIISAQKTPSKSQSIALDDLTYTACFSLLRKVGGTLPSDDRMSSLAVAFDVPVNAVRNWFLGYLDLPKPSEDEANPTERDIDVDLASIHHQGRRKRPRGKTSCSVPLDKQKVRRYACTYRCGCTFASKPDWRRHEDEIHRPRKLWICPNQSCQARKNKGVFTRSYRMRDHLSKFHMGNHKDISEYETNLELDFDRRCVFRVCDWVFQSWDEKFDHTETHFKRQWDYSEWNEPSEKTAGDNDENGLVKKPSKKPSRSYERCSDLDNDDGDDHDDDNDDDSGDGLGRRGAGHTAERRAKNTSKRPSDGSSNSYHPRESTSAGRPHRQHSAYHQPNHIPQCKTAENKRPIKQDWACPRFQHEMSDESEGEFLPDIVEALVPLSMPSPKSAKIGDTFGDFEDLTHSPSHVLSPPLHGDNIPLSVTASFDQGQTTSRMRPPMSVVRLHNFSKGRRKRNAAVTSNPTRDTRCQISKSSNKPHSCPNVGCVTAFRGQNDLNKHLRTCSFLEVLRKEGDYSEAETEPSLVDDSDAESTRSSQTVTRAPLKVYELPHCFEASSH